MVPSQNQWHMMAMPPDIDGLIQGWATVQSTWYFYDSFEPNDTRKTYLLPEYTTGNGEVRNRENPDQYLDLALFPKSMRSILRFPVVADIPIWI